MDFARLVTFFDALEATSGRLEMTRIVTDLLREAEAEEAGPLVHLLQGAVAPDWEGVESGLAEKLVLQALARAAGLDARREDVAASVTSAYHEAGDLGLAAERLLGHDARSRQAGLLAFGEEAALSVRDVHARLLQIATTAGADSQGRKQRLLERLLSEVSPREARYIVRVVAGRLRLGVADMTVLDALTAWHLGGDVRSVQEMEPEERAVRDGVRARLERAYDLRSDLALVASTLLGQGLEAVDRLGIALGTPLRPMAAERLRDLGEILEKHGGRSALEYKYDGLRMQAHVPAEGPVRLFSRRLEDLTAQFPDVTAALRASFRGREAIVEGECVAVDPSTDRMRPFQEVSRRRGRKTDLSGEAVTTLAGASATAGRDITKEVPVVLFLFDCLMADGEPLLSEGYEARRAWIPRMFSLDASVRLSAMEAFGDEAGMEMFFQRAVADGAEGIMAKRPDAPYKAGSRGFDWIKYKTDYTAELVDTMDLVVIGAFHGRGRRAGWYGALLMACRDPATGTYASLCKLGTGFDDATLKGLKERFAELIADERPPDVDSAMTPDVWIRPQLVLEVQAAELTLSPVHRAAWGRLRDGAGLAARFPRFSGRWRDDKGPEDATAIDEVVRLYEEQGKK